MYVYMYIYIYTYLYVELCISAYSIKCIVSNSKTSKHREVFAICAASWCTT